MAQPATTTKFVPLIISAVKQPAHQLSDLATTVASFAQSFTTKELTFTRATGESLTLTRELCIDASDRTPVCVTGDQLRALLSHPAAAASISVPSSPSEIREPAASTTPSDLTNSAQPDNANWTPPANDNDPPAEPSGSAEPAADEPADPIEAAASPAPPASDEPPADQTSPPTPDVSTPLPVNDNIPPPSAEAI